jgi:hypothetical protein
MFFPIMSGYIASYASNGVVTLFFVLVTVLVASTFFTALARKTLTLLSS